MTSQEATGGASTPPEAAAWFLESLFDRRFYAAKATEALAVGLFDRKATPWPFGGLRERDTHFSCALFEWNTPESVNDFRRTKERRTGNIGIVLDDIGEIKNGVRIKAPPVKPTAIIETKPGSQQWIYLFNEIVRDPREIEAMLRSAIAGGMCDPDAGNITRITRLPGSLPVGKTHRARLIWADWSRRFNPAAIIDKAFQVPRVDPPAPQEYGAPNLSAETSEAGKEALEAACHKIRSVGGVTGSGTINAQSFFVGQNVGAGLIALADAEAMLFAAAYDRHPADGVRQARNGLQAGILKPLRRQGNGRFTGAGVTELAEDETQPASVFREIGEAREEIRTTLQGFIDQALQYDDLEGETPPVMALAATPGAGKTGAALKVLSETDLTCLPGDVVFHSPTRALAEQAARDFEKITGTPAHVTRGRSAKQPGTDAPMCARADLAEHAARAELKVKTTLCEAKDASGNRRRCPHFDNCPYLKQWESLPEHPVIRFETTGYLPLASDGSGRETGMRVIDETIWRQFCRNVDIAFDEWLAPRPIGDDPGTAVDATDAAHGVLSALLAGKSPVGGKYTADDFAAFRAAEIEPINLRDCAPDSQDDNFHLHLAHYEASTKGGRRNAALWAVLEDCARREIQATERIRIITTDKGETKIRVTWFSQPPAKVPTLLLDADATGAILDRMYPGAQLVAVDLKPNAHVVQLTDRTFSNTKLQKVSVRRELVNLVRAEVLRDDGRGVLCIATRKVVRAMFEDAGHDFTGVDEQTVSEKMMSTPLHGARWLWFGPASLGRNDWQDFGTALVIGREDIGVDALEDLSRAFFGDTGEPLRFVRPDDKGNRFMPETVLPVAMETGERFGIFGRAHPDRRTRDLQEQTREFAARQAIERLRLVNATERKRVVICTTVPLPGLPVSDLLRWDKLVPRRLEAAIAEANQRGRVLRLSASGLAADAPETFRSVKAAEHWLAKGGREEIADLTTPAGNKTLLPAGVVTFAVLKMADKGARTTRAIILGSDPEKTAERALGQLAKFEVAS